VTSRAPKVAQPDMSSPACCVAGKALHVVAVALPLGVLLLLPCSGVNARAARKGTWDDWARKLEKENELSGPLNGSHLTFHSLFFFVSIFRNPLLHKSTKCLGALSNA
jgi:hypothetical protein